MRAVLASANPNKARELRDVLRGWAIEPLGVELPDETGSSFYENARAKAEFARTVSPPDVWVLADDSGLEVDALDGAPGVRSARYAGDDATDEANNAKLVAALAGTSEHARTCRYRCVAVFVAPDGREHVATGSCEGTVVLEGRGTLGFGYDPYVVPDGETRTMGEIPLDEKLRFSHRGRAFRDLARLLDR